MAKKNMKSLADAFANEKDIINQDIADTCAEFMKISGANKNLYRIAPLINDGLKPVERRTLFTYYMDVFKKAGYKLTKVEKWVGNTLTYHPHGSTGVYDTIVGMAQEWNNNQCLVYGQGNFGNISGDPAAAGRYINARLTKFAYKCFFENFEHGHVPMQQTYTGDDMEPVYLPARYPYLLLNGLLGIGYSVAANIPPFNLTEVFETTMALMDNEKANVYLVPDFPTGASVVDKGEFRDLFETGKGTVVSRAVVEVDERANTLTITRIPIRTTMDGIKKSIVSAIVAKKYPEIERYDDYTGINSGTTGVNFRIKLQKDVNAKKFLKKLYKGGHDLEKTYPVDLNLVRYQHGYAFCHRSIRQFLLDWIDYRRSHVAAALNNEYLTLKEELIINEIIAFITDPAVKDKSGVSNAEKTIVMFQKASSRADIEEKLLSTFTKIPHWDDFKKKMVKQSLTRLQARTISSLGLTRFLKDERQKVLEKIKEITVRITALMDLILDPNGSDKIIKQELKEGIELFGEPRKSRIVKNKKESDIPDIDRIVVVTKSGTIQKINPNDPITNISTSEPIWTLYTNDMDSVVVFDSHGDVGKINVVDIPYTRKTEPGTPIGRYVKLTGDIVNILPFVEQDVREGLTALLITKNGYVKKTDVAEFGDLNRVTSALALDNGDELAIAAYVMAKDKSDIIMSTNLGRGWRFGLDDIPIYRKQARGLKFSDLPLDEYIVSAGLIDTKCKYLFYMTSKGRGKVTEIKYLPKSKRRTEPLVLIPLAQKESLIGIFSCSKTDEFMILTRNGSRIPVKISDLPVTGRANKPDKLLPTKGDAVVKVIMKI